MRASSAAICGRSCAAAAALSAALATEPVSAFFSALMFSTLVNALRRASSSASTRSTNPGSWPRRRADSRTPSGSRRIKAMSIMIANRRVMRSTQTLLPGATFDPKQLSTPQQAIAAFRAAVALGPRGTERVALSEAVGRVLAGAAVATQPVPADNRSTMDGFAVRSADGSASRRISGEIRMGQAPPGPLGAGEAMAIPTGGVLPQGADAVVPVEDVTVDGSTLVVHEAPEAHACYTPRGSDLAPGDCVIPAGRRLGGPEIGVLATLGMSEVEVFMRPRFAVVSTGDELVDV